MGHKPLPRPPQTTGDARCHHDVLVWGERVTRVGERHGGEHEFVSWVRVWDLHVGAHRMVGQPGGSFCPSSPSLPSPQTPPFHPQPIFQSTAADVGFFVRAHAADPVGGPPGHQVS